MNIYFNLIIIHDNWYIEKSTIMYYLYQDYILISFKQPQSDQRTVE